MTSNSNFVTFSKKLQKTIDLVEIAKRWNASGLGRPAKHSTVKRWLNNGPKTKNPQFEPWVLEQVKDLQKTSTPVSIKKPGMMVEQKLQLIRSALDEGQAGSTKQQATITGLLAYYSVFPELSSGQIKLLDNVCGNICR